MSLNNLRIFFSLICMIFVYYILSQNSSFSELILNIQQINLNYLFLLVVINILSICLIFVRFNFLIQFADIKFLQKVYIVLNANLFNALPFPGLAEANKIYDVKKKIGIENGILLVSIEKLFSLLVYIILFLISFLIISSNIYIKTLIVLFFLFLIYFFLNKEKITYIGYIFQRVRFLQKKKFLIIFTFIISIFIQLIGIFNQFLIFKLAGVVSIDNYYYVFLIIVITNFISSLPISFAGFGVRDLLILFMGTKLLLIPDYSALLISTIANSLILVTHAICFAVSVSLFIFLKKEKHLNNKIDKQVQKK